MIASHVKAIVYVPLPSVVLCDMNLRVLTTVKYGMFERQCCGNSVRFGDFANTTCFETEYGFTI